MTETVVCLVSVGKLARFLVCTLLVTQTVACPFSGSELVCFSMCTLLVTEWPVLFQRVSWLVFNVHSSGDTDGGLSFYRR